MTSTRRRGGEELRVVGWCVTVLVMVTLLTTRCVTARSQVAAVGEVDSAEEDNGEEATCQNLDPECDQLDAQGECETNPAYMEIACQVSCGTCRPQSRVEGCSDRRDECQVWGLRGECDLNPAFMNVNCAQTCNSCPPAEPEDCVDQHKFCFLGSLLGLCRTNPSFYLIFCADSCRRFIPVCSQGRSSTVPDLCFTRALGQESECGVDPTTAAIRRRRRHAVGNTTVADQDRGTTGHHPHTHTYTSGTQQNGPRGEHVFESHWNTSATHESGNENLFDILRAKLRVRNNLSLAWWIIMAEGLRKGIQWGKLEGETLNLRGGKGFSWVRSAYHARQIDCCNNGSIPGTGNGGEGGLEHTIARGFKWRDRRMWPEYNSMWYEQGSGNGEVLEELDSSREDFDGVWDKYNGLWEEQDGLSQEWDSKMEEQDAVEERRSGMAEEQCNREDKQCNLKNEELRADEQGLATDATSPSDYRHSSPVGRQARQNGDPCANVECPVVPVVIDLCRYDLPHFNMTIDMCIVLPTLILTPAIMMLAISGVSLPPSPPPPRFPPSRPQAPPAQSPQSPSPQSPQSPSPQSPQSPSPQSPQSPIPPLPPPAPTQPSPEVRIRTLVPFCTGLGYLSLVERLRRLTTGNTGRPLNPTAASLAGSVNYCKYGVGTVAGTVGSVPEAPQQLAAPSVATILLRDEEADMALQTPQRWPGISLPALHLYQSGGQPPRPFVRPPRPATNATVVTTVFIANGTIISNTSQVFVGVTPDIGVAGGESVPGGEVVPGAEGVPGGQTPGAGAGEGVGAGEGAGVDGAGAADGTDGGDGADGGGDGGAAAGDGGGRGPRPVTQENLGSRLAFPCGGALISPYHVLTAAHCLIAPGLSETTEVKFQKPSVVRLGEVDFKEADESQAFDYEVAGIQVHEGYALPAKYNDIALITLKDRVQFTSALRPYCLPRRQDDLVGRRCTVSGWGRRPGGVVSTVLHNIEVEVVSQEECGAAYLDDTATRPFFQIDYPDGITQAVLCAGRTNNVCRGDSGGPLVLEEAGVQEEVGVVSTGYGCGSVNFPGIYTRVDQFTAWIEAEIYGEC